MKAARRSNSVMDAISLIAVFLLFYGMLLCVFTISVSYAICNGYDAGSIIAGSSFVLVPAAIFAAGAIMVKLTDDIPIRGYLLDH